MNTYEVMLLLDPAFASNEEDANKEIDRLMERAGGQIIARHRWDERRLAYEIKRRKRGVYVLMYVRAPGTSIPSLQRDVELSEGILRALILRADHVSEEKMHNPIAPPSEYARRGGDEWWRGSKRAERRPGAEGRPAREAGGRPTREAPVAPAEATETEPVTASPEDQGAPAAETEAAPSGPQDSPEET